MHPLRLSKMLRQVAHMAPATPLPPRLEEAVPLSDIYGKSPLSSALHLHNPTRMPFLRRVWERQFENRQLFGLGWAGYFLTVTFFALGGYFSPAPMERADISWMNSVRFRMMTAYINQGRRPGYEIEKTRGDIRYNYRGLDHNFSLDEKYDLLFKLRENYLIEKHPGIQYPYVYRQLNKIQEQPDVFPAKVVGI